MPLLQVGAGHSGVARRGDVVFDAQARDPEFPVHAGIHVGQGEVEIGPASRVEVLGVPAEPEPPPGGASPSSDRSGPPLPWKVSGQRTWGDPNQYQVDLVGQIADLDRLKVGAIATIAGRLHQELPTGIRWKGLPRADLDPIAKAGGFAVFRRGTCTQFVNYAYRCGGVELVDEDGTAEKGKGLRGAALAYAFHAGRLPHAEPWNDASWPACVGIARPWPFAWYFRRVRAAFDTALSGRTDVTVEAPSTPSDGTDLPVRVALVSATAQPTPSAVVPGGTLLVVVVDGSPTLTDPAALVADQAAAGVPEAWVVHVPCRTVHVHRGPSAAGYAERLTYAMGGLVSPAHVQSVEIATAEILSPA